MNIYESGETEMNILHEMRGREKADREEEEGSYGREVEEGNKDEKARNRQSTKGDEQRGR